MDTKAVQKEVGDILVAAKFVPVRDKRFVDMKNAHPNFVDEWERSENRGFWYGPEYLSVEMDAKQDLILLVVDSDFGGRRAPVEEIRTTLENMLHNKFPDLKVQVTSYSYVSIWAP